ncbi:MAG: hypothetical protein JSW47_21640, partial [Phycisphaerales bacterium]
MRRARKSFFTIVSLTAMGSLSVVAAGPLARGNDNAKAERMVAEILGAHASQTQIQYLTKTYGSFSIERAYEIQALLAEGL